MFTVDVRSFLRIVSLCCLSLSFLTDGFLVKTVKGMLYNPLFGSWSWTESTSINYALHAVKADIQEQVDPNLEIDKEQLQTKTNGIITSS